MAAILVGLLAMASTTTAIVDKQLAQVAHNINKRHTPKRLDFRNAVIVGRMLYADVVSAQPVPLSPEAVVSYVRQATCANQVMRNIVAIPSVEFRFNVSAPNWANPVVASVRAADCGLGPATPTSAPAPSIRTAAMMPQPVPTPPVATLRHTGSSYDFKGVPLGISYNEFRRLAHPDGMASQVVCTGDKLTYAGLATDPPEVSIYNSIQKAVGMRKCIWLGMSGLGAGHPAGLDLAGSGYAVNDYSFSFIPDPRDGVLRLFRFQGMTNSKADDMVVQALTAKFGKPKVTTGIVQNGLGSRFDQVTDEWADATGSLIVQSPAQSVNKMAIVMTDKRLSKYVEDQEAAKRAALPNGI